jgi:hypothetical protein
MTMMTLADGFLGVPSHRFGSFLSRRYLSSSEATTGLREENRRKDHLLAAALERIPPQIEAPQEARESPETVEEEPERAEPRPATGEAQGGVQRPWWRRVFGG